MKGDKRKGMGVSPITNTIYYGTLKDTGKGFEMWTGKREIVTDEAIKAVFEWFMHNMEDNHSYSISFPNLPYVLEMRRKEETSESQPTKV